MATKLTKTYVDTLSLSYKRLTYWDSELKGFGVRVGTTSKVYVTESKLKGKTVRTTIGKHGVYTPEQARAQAREILLSMSKGINPNVLKKEERTKSITLEEAFEDFQKARSSLKPRTICDYKRMLNNYLADWKNKQIIDISKDMVGRRHKVLGEENGLAQANLAMRFLRSLLNFSAGQYENNQGQSLIIENPVKRLSQTRSWYRVDRRRTVIKSYELKAWMKAVLNLKNDYMSEKREVIRDYLLLILFTGLRREEAAQLTWNKVDFQAKTLTIPDPKNREDHTLPLSDYIYTLLIGRKAKAINGYVFPGDGKAGHIVEPRKQMKRVTDESSIAFTVHDLRRTFVTVAESLDIPAYALKRLLNHKTKGDVTADYIVIDVERLRKPIQQITDFILETAGINQVKSAEKYHKEPQEEKHEAAIIQ